MTASALATAACGGGAEPASKGNVSRGAKLFAERCASCHGDRGTGGTAPGLAGASMTLDFAKARIDGGASGMPAALVDGQDEKDVLAYLAGILVSP